MARGDAHLVCRAGGVLVALPVDTGMETMRPLAVEAIEGSPEAVLGIALVRGRPTPVVSVERLVAGTTDGSVTRFVTIALGDRAIALAVDAVLGLRTLGPEAAAPLPALLAEAPAEVLATIGELDAELVVALRPARIVPESVWQALDGPATAP